MNNGNGVSRGDRNRNARLSRLRVLVPACNAIVGIDLADKKQMVVVTDHDSKVLARRTFRCRAWDLGLALDWAAERAARSGFAGATVAREPTGHRWRVLGQLAVRGRRRCWCLTARSRISWSSEGPLAAARCSQRDPLRTREVPPRVKGVHSFSRCRGARHDKAFT
jgi:hypothetical protein